MINIKKKKHALTGTLVEPRVWPELSDSKLTVPIEKITTPAQSSPEIIQVNIKLMILEAIPIR